MAVFERTYKFRRDLRLCLRSCLSDCLLYAALLEPCEQKHLIFICVRVVLWVPGKVAYFNKKCEM